MPSQFSINLFIAIVLRWQSVLTVGTTADEITDYVSTGLNVFMHLAVRWGESITNGMHINQASIIFSLDFIIQSDASARLMARLIAREKVVLFTL